MARSSIYVGSFSVALWLIAHGHQPTGIVVDPASGKSRFIFPDTAQPAFDTYTEAKDALNKLIADQGGR
jgi:hypothetical protein